MGLRARHGALRWASGRARGPKDTLRLFPRPPWAGRLHQLPQAPSPGAQTRASLWPPPAQPQGVPHRAQSRGGGWGPPDWAGVGDGRQGSRCCSGSGPISLSAKLKAHNKGLCRQPLSVAFPAPARPAAGHQRGQCQCRGQTPGREEGGLSGQQQGEGGSPRHSSVSNRHVHAATRSLHRLTRAHTCTHSHPLPRGDHTTSGLTAHTTWEGCPTRQLRGAGSGAPAPTAAPEVSPQK